MYSEKASTNLTSITREKNRWSRFLEQCGWLTLFAADPASPVGKRRDLWRLVTSKDGLGYQRRATDALVSWTAL